MKYTLILLFITFFTSIWGQDWDTVYSDDKDVEIKVEISYYNCYFVNIDTTYYLTTYVTDPDNRRLFHAKTKDLLFERSVSNDTTYCFSYYHSGKMKVRDVSYQHKWLHHATYYENGQLQSGGDIYAGKLYPWNRYYPDGKIMSKGIRYDYLNLFGRYEEYFPNGQLSSILNFTLPDTSITSYQSSELISGEYFELDGSKVDTNSSVINLLTIPLQPEMDSPEIQQIDTLYTRHAVSSQVGYLNDLAELKFEISQNLTIPKSCNCSTGIAWVGFIVCKDGSIKNMEVDFPNECVNSTIKKALQKLNKWNSATIDNEKVDVYVYTYLIIE